MSERIRMPRKTLRLLGLALAAWAPVLAAAEFVINPLRLTLDRSNRATEVVIRNEDKVPLRMQVQAMSWQQDSAGNDQYEPSDRLIYFPRAVEIPAGESRIVRVGIRTAPVAIEEAYRLFIEELPPPGEEAAATSASVRVLIRVGVPVFVAPARAERKPELTQPAVKSAQVRWSVSNAGNVHFAADRVELSALARDGKPLLTHQFKERYFLAGTVKPLQSDLPPEICVQAAAVEVSVVGENLDLRRRIDVEPGACR